MVLRLEGFPKFCLMFVVVAGSMCLAYVAGPVFERLFFAGNFKSWLNGGTGSAAPFLFVLIMPVMGLLVSLLSSRIFGYRFTVYLRKTPMPYSALLDFLRWLGTAVATAALSYALAVFFEALGLDPRDGLVGTYVQRNTLIVSFAMGFAVIPIIYTLADDALTSVPGPSAFGKPGLWGDTLADSGLDRPADCSKRGLFGSHDRNGARLWAKP